MFKIGDKVICIKDSSHGFFVEKYKIYTILDFNHNKTSIDINDNGVLYDVSRFVSLQEYRKQKILKLYNESDLY